MDHERLIKSFRNILASYKLEISQDDDFASVFAKKRFLKKMEVPNDANSKTRKELTWNNYISFDRDIPARTLYPGNWYKARLMIHRVLRNFCFGNVSFSNGSEVTNTGGFNSLESKLQRSQWDCTLDCFDLWAELAYNNRAIKSATRQRFERLCYRNGLDRRSLLKRVWKSAGGTHEQKAFTCFKFMLSHVTIICQGSRFSTVRKNNEIDRPIDIQPLCNMLVQRSIGLGLKDCLLKEADLDIDSVAQLHGRLIRSPARATIDLKNASDAILLKFVRFLLPKKIFDYVSDARCSMTFGLDKQYHVLRKVSSMGNGFTFELMTLILLSIARVYDNEASVFGDDIIISNDCAERFISDITYVGFVVNAQKTFINSNFRESCGSNYLDGFGYIESYDFIWPDTVLDCVMIFNKSYLLSHIDAFDKLHKLLRRAIPLPCRGVAPSYRHELGRVPIDTLKDSMYFWYYSSNARLPPVPSLSSCKESPLVKSLNLGSEKYRFFGFKMKSKLASPTRSHLKLSKHYGKYYMYLHSARRTADEISNMGDIVNIRYVVYDSGIYKMSALRKLQKAFC